MVGNNPVNGAMYLLKGIKLLGRPGLRRYVIIPLSINVLVFSLLIWLGINQFERLLLWMLPQNSWLAWLEFLLWPLFAIATILITFYSFTIIANLLAAPFNGVLSQRVEQILTGNIPPEGDAGLIQSIWPAVRSEIIKLSYFLLRALPLLILFLIPVLNLVAPMLWILFGIWYLALEYADYPMSNHGLDFGAQRIQMQRSRLTALGFGGGLTLMMMVPLVNFIAMPAAVAGATAMWCEREEKEK